MTAGGPAWPLYGHDTAQDAFIGAFHSGRMHHAWLIEGPSGIGKARLAQRIAAFLLGARGPESAPLDAPRDDSVVQKVTAGSHPDLRWLRRREDDKGKLSQDIPVAEARGLISFFGLSSGAGGWRVGVVDSLDEMNRFGANAILKTLEEPPKDCALILISHGARPVLPTIRSRCRVLRLSTLNEADTKRAIDEAADDLSPEDAASALSLARGRPGFGLSLTGSSALAAANAARQFAKGLPSPSDGAVTGLIQTMSVDEAAFRSGLSELLAGLEGRAETDPGVSAVWLALSKTAAETDALNMDRTQSAAKIAASVKAGMKAG